jgi:5-methylcytosine-specific restriction protein A
VDPASKGRYGGAWQEIRRRVLKESPMCEMCGRPATDVDHRIAVADGGTDDRSNLRSFCRSCHKAHKAEQNRARRKRKLKLVRK